MLDHAPTTTIAPCIGQNVTVRNKHRLSDKLYHSWTYLLPPKFLGGKSDYINLSLSHLPSPLLPCISLTQLPQSNLCDRHFLSLRKNWLTGHSRNHPSHQRCVCFADSEVGVGDDRRPMKPGHSLKVGGFTSGLTGRDVSRGENKTVAVAVTGLTEDVRVVL